VGWPGGEESESGPRRIVMFLNYSKISNRLKLIRSKDGIPEFKKFQIKYEFIGIK
jgi:hypothetical protein